MVTDERLAEMLAALIPASGSFPFSADELADALTELQSLRASIPGDVGVKVDDLAQEIRRVDGDNSLGAGRLAEALLPFLSALDPSPADTQCCMCGKTGLSTIEGDGGTECQLEDGRWACSEPCWEKAGGYGPDLSPAEGEPVVSDEVVEAAKRLLAHWDKNAGPEKRGEYAGVQYWSPAGRMVDTDFIADLRAALSVKPRGENG